MFVAYPTVRWGTNKAKSDHSLLLANAQLCAEWADEVKIFSFSTVCPYYHYLFFKMPVKPRDIARPNSRPTELIKFLVKRSIGESLRR